MKSTHRRLLARIIFSTVLILALGFSSSAEKTISTAPPANGSARYTVEFNYGEREYVMAGDTSAALAEILPALGLTGEVTAVEISDESLFSASDETGEWVVTAHRAFDTAERMRVTVGGADYTIAVTDDEEIVGVSYVERRWNGTAVVSETKKHNAFPVPANGNMKSGWYILNRNVTKDGRVESINGNVNLILGDGYTLDVKGLYVPPNTTLTVYSQSAGTGRLYSHPSGGAGIGGYSGHDNGSIVIHGGVVDAYGYDHCAGIGTNDGRNGGSITIYGGTITAKGGGDGAGIGGGRDRPGGVITIYGGTIKANEGPNENGAGIGGGDDGNGGTITINGGTITAWSRDGAGIGGGADGDGGTIIINGGSITVWDVGEANGARIGGGDNKNGGNITINGGEITVRARDGAGIGGGADGDGGTITINGGNITVLDEGEANGARIGGGDGGDGGNITINDGVLHLYFRDGAGIGGGQDSDGGRITINGGEIHSNAAEGSGGMGAAIGGGNGEGDGGTITITGGTVEAISFHGAGIGGGRAGNPDSYIGVDIPASGDGGNITITGGVVHASSDYGYGIGAGGHSGYNIKDVSYPSDKTGWWLFGDAGTINIGGTADVVAEGRIAGIGGNEGTINITGGRVDARGSTKKNNGSGFLMHENCSLNISGGHVIATGIDKNAGISVQWREVVNITGGIVEAYADKGAAIGGYAGFYENKGDLAIRGEGTVVKAHSAQGMAIYVDEYGLDYEFDPGITVETYSGGKGSGDKDQNFFYDRARYTAGSSAETATVLAAEARRSAHQSAANKYILVEPCDHAGTVDENFRCAACGHVLALYTATFDPANGEESFIAEVREGRTVARPEPDPVREGYYFLGWRPAQSDAGDVFDFNTPVNGNLALTAVWLEKIEAVVPTCSDGGYVNGNREYYMDAANHLYLHNSGTGAYTATDAEGIVTRYFDINKNSSGVVRVVAYNGMDGEITIPERVPAELANPSVETGEVITAINQSAFRDNRVITRVTMGDAIDHIGWKAFCRASNLEEITIGSGLFRIDSSAFEDCPKLTRFTCTTRTMMSAVQYVFGADDQISHVTFYGYHSGSSSSFQGLVKSNAFAKTQYPRTFIGLDRHDEPSWTWAEDFSSATATFGCARCSFAETVVDEEIEREPTVVTTYTAKVAVNGYEYTDKVIKENDLPAPSFFLPESLTTIGNEAFSGIAAEAVLIPANVTEITGDPFAGSAVRYIYGSKELVKNFAEEKGYVFVLIGD